VVERKAAEGLLPVWERREFPDKYVKVLKVIPDWPLAERAKLPQRDQAEYSSSGETIASTTSNTLSDEATMEILREWSRIFGSLKI